MSARYFVQLDGEDSPRGPLTAAAVRRLIEQGSVLGATPACQEGDADWVTLEDFWDDIHAAAAPAVVRAPLPAMRVPVSTAPPPVAAMQPVPIPVWRLVYGVCFLVGSFSSFCWALLAALAVWKVPDDVGTVKFLVSCIGAGSVNFILGFWLTRKPS